MINAHLSVYPPTRENISLDNAQESFRDSPNNVTAKKYAEALIAYHSDEMIGNDTLRSGLIEIADDLTGATNDLGWMVQSVTILI